MAYDKNTFPQTGDPNDGERFAQLAGQQHNLDYVEEGFGITYDSSVPEATVGGGVCYISVSSATSPTDSLDVNSLGYVVQAPSTTLSLTDNDVNYIYVEANVGTTDDPTVGATTTQQTVDDRLYIANIDTSSDIVDEINRLPPIDEGSADDPHDVGGDQHSPDRLSNFNTKISDATLDDTNSARVPEIHGPSKHTTDVTTGPDTIVQNAEPAIAETGTTWVKPLEQADTLWKDVLYTSSDEKYAITTDGTYLYIASFGNNTVAAVDPSDRSIVWEHTHHSDPVKDVHHHNSTIYSCGRDGNVIAADASDGSQQWSHSLHATNNVNSVHATGSEVYSCCGNDSSTDAYEVIAADDTNSGAELWTHTHHSENVRGVYELSGTVYSVGLDNNAIAASASDGSLTWTYSHGSSLQSVFATSSAAYVGDDTGDIVSLDQTYGSANWTSSLHSNTIDDIYIDTSIDTIYTGSRDNTIIASDLKNNASVIWSNSVHTDTVRGVSVYGGDPVTASWDGSIARILANGNDNYLRTFISNNNNWLFEKTLTSTSPF